MPKRPATQDIVVAKGWREAFVQTRTRATIDGATFDKGSTVGLDSSASEGN
jgi:hypothetical protein